MIKIKYKPILAFAAALIILFVFLTVPASASALSGINADVSTDAPVSIDIAINGTKNEPGSDYPTYYFSLAPLISPSIMDNDTTADFIRSQVYGDHPFICEADFYPEAFNTSLSLYNSGLYGYCSYEINNVGIINDSSSITNYYLDSCYIYLRDFYVWSEGLFDSYESNYTQQNLLENSQSNISFRFLGDYDNTNVSISRVDVICYPAGKPLQRASHAWYESTLSDILYDGTLNLNTQNLASDGVEEVYDLYYVEYCAIKLFNLPQNTIDLLRLNFYVRYYLNPFIDDYLYYSVPSENDDNPALALIPYTTWLGEAVGGFMDFELFKGFTLGGIFMTILAFSCVMWYLKLVAGG